MRTPSIRTMAALAYERGEEFDPAAAPTPALVEWLAAASAATCGSLRNEPASPAWSSEVHMVGSIACCCCSGIEHLDGD